MAPSYSEPQILGIPEWFSGRTILITGATGFVGKSLVERLLSTVPDISILLLMVRAKQGSSAKERLDTIKQSSIFDVIRVRNPSQLDKLYVVSTEFSLPNLGMPDPLKTLQEVSVVFHCAASTRFEQPLRDAVNDNLLSVTKLMDVCNRLPKLESFVYVSTGFCNAHLSEIGEFVYPSSMKFQQLLELLAETKDDRALNICVSKMIYPKPNMYTFTKALAENIIQERDRLYPVAIFRPTMVVPALKNPCPGWVQDHRGGVSAITAGVSAGVIHAFRLNLSARADMMPVDITADTLIAVAWETGVDKLKDIRVYNCSSYENPTHWKQFTIALLKNIRLFPSKGMVWYPGVCFFENRYGIKICEVFRQTSFLYGLEYFYRLFRIKKKVDFIRLSKKIQKMTELMHFFAVHEWYFHTDNVKRLRARLSAKDAEIFNLDPQTINWNDYNKILVRGVRRYIQKETEEDLPEARLLLQTYYVLQSVIMMALFAILFISGYFIINQIIHF